MGPGRNSYQIFKFLQKIYAHLGTFHAQHSATFQKCLNIRAGFSILSALIKVIMTVRGHLIRGQGHLKGQLIRGQGHRKGQTIRCQGHLKGQMISDHPRQKGRQFRGQDHPFPDQDQWCRGRGQGHQFRGHIIQYRSQLNGGIFYDRKGAKIYPAKLNLYYEFFGNDPKCCGILIMPDMTNV